MSWPAILLAVQNHDLHQHIKRPLLLHGAEVLEASNHAAILECLDANSPRLLVICRGGRRGETRRSPRSWSPGPSSIADR
jgi:hypothetical protein